MNRTRIGLLFGFEEYWQPYKPMAFGFKVLQSGIHPETPEQY